MELELSEVGEQESDLEDDEGEKDLDSLPEYYQYRDEGCELAASCLNCPFPRCVYEVPRGKQRWLKEMRGRKMARLFAMEGKGVKDLAKQFGVSRRTVQRALKRSLNKGGLNADE